MHLKLKRFNLKRTTRLSIAIGISFSFFIAEIAFGFKTRSIALIADAFHYLNDLIGFIVALVAILISEKGKTHKDLTFGWQRAQLLGAFFNGVFLLALGVSILLQSLERFINMSEMEHPMYVVIIGAIGLFLNLICISFLHGMIIHLPYNSYHLAYLLEHDHGHGHEERPGPVPLTVPSETGITDAEIGLSNLDIASDTRFSIDQSKEVTHHEHRHQVKKSSGHHHRHHDYGMAGIILHVAGDAVNNLGVIIVGLIVWLTHSPHRYYADPAVGTFIALMILISSLPLVKRTGHILLQSPPTGLDVEDIKHDLEKIPGIVSVHELHVWRLNQEKSLASAHIVIDDSSLERFHKQAKTINECLHAYGVHSATIQPELIRRRTIASRPESSIATIAAEGGVDGPNETASIPPTCAISCGDVCEKMTCCG